MPIINSITTRFKQVIHYLYLYLRRFCFCKQSAQRSETVVFIHLGVVGDLILFYRFIEKYYTVQKQKIALITLQNARPFLEVLDANLQAIDFQKSFFIDPNPVSRLPRHADRVIYKKLCCLDASKVYTFVYDNDIYTFLLTALFRTKEKYIFVEDTKFLNTIGKTIVQARGIKTPGAKIYKVQRVVSHAHAFSYICKTKVSYDPVKIGHRQRGNYIVVAPFASHKKREYPYEKFKEFANKLYDETGISSIFIGLSQRKEQDSQAIKYAYNIPIQQLQKIVTGAICCVGNDSGLSHFALRYDIPTIVLYTPCYADGIYFPYGNVTLLQRCELEDIAVSEILYVVRRFVS